MNRKTWLLAVLGACLLLVLAVGFTFLWLGHFSSRDDSHENTYEDYVKIIDSYDFFKKSYSNVTEPADLTSRQNYALYIEIATKEYKESFSLEEIRTIAEFYGSPLGKRFLQHSLESKALDRLLSQISSPEIWTCNTHANIRLHEGGKCPICGRELVKKTYLKAE